MCEEKPGRWPARAAPVPPKATGWWQEALQWRHSVSGERKDGSTAGRRPKTPGTSTLQRCGLGSGDLGCSPQLTRPGPRFGVSVCKGRRGPERQGPWHLSSSSKWAVGSMSQFHQPLLRLFCLPRGAGLDCKTPVLVCSSDLCPARGWGLGIRQ